MDKEQSAALPKEPIHNYQNFVTCIEAEKLSPVVMGPSDEIRYRFETFHVDWERRLVIEVVGGVGQYIVGKAYPFELTLFVGE